MMRRMRNRWYRCYCPALCSGLVTGVVAPWLPKPPDKRFAPHCRLHWQRERENTQSQHVVKHGSYASDTSELPSAPQPLLPTLITSIHEPGRHFLPQFSNPTPLTSIHEPGRLVHTRTQVVCPAVMVGCDGARHPLGNTHLHPGASEQRLAGVGIELCGPLFKCRGRPFSMHGALLYCQTPLYRVLYIAVSK